MNRRSFVAVLGIALLLSLRAHAETATNPWRIGLLGDAPASFWDALRQGLRELGYEEGRNIVIEYGNPEGDYNRLPSLAEGLVQRRTDLIVSAGISATHAAKRATATTPIVMVIGSDPVATGLIAAMAHPGGNITGLASMLVELNSKRLQLLHDAFPAVARVGLVANSTSSAYSYSVASTEAAARGLGLELTKAGVRGPDELEQAFAAVKAAGAGAVFVLSSTMFFKVRTTLAEIAARERLPTMFPDREFVEAGGLMSYAPNLPATYRHAASYVDRVLKGAAPAEMPVEQPTTFELVVNVKAAKALGLTIPPAILLRASEVIE
jgi:putative ABC transport system substrate-binding protein